MPADLPLWPAALAASVAVGLSLWMLGAALTTSRVRCRAREHIPPGVGTGGRAATDRQAPGWWPLHHGEPAALVARAADAWQRRRVPRSVRTRELAHCLDGIARRVLVGESLGAALIAEGGSASAPPIARAARDHRNGAPLPTALHGASHNTVAADADDAFALAVLTATAEHGGAVAEALDRAAATLRERANLAEERHAQAASARLSAQVMTLVPLAFAAFSVATDDRVRRLLFSTPLGWSCVVVGVGLNLVGRHWTSRIVTAAS